MKKVVTTRVVDWARAFYKKVTGLSDSPRKVAAGVALGVAFDFLPIPVISIPLSYLVARLSRCNPVAAVATVVFLKPAVPFFFTLNLILGNAILGDLPGPAVNMDSVSFMGTFLGKLVEHGYPFLLGSLVNATAVWLAVYTLLVVVLERKRRRGGA